jgi:hypothetical protein
MKRIFATFLLVLVMGAFAAQPTAPPKVSLAWDPSTDPDVTNYNVYYGLNHTQYTVMVPAGNVTNFVITNLIYGWNTNYYFAATAVNSVGLESDYSNEATYAPTTNNIGTATNVVPPVLSITKTTTP